MNRKDYLVYIKEINGGFANTHAEFKPYTPYRCIEVSEGDNTQMLVFGCVFEKDEFDMLFDYVQDRVLIHWETLGLIVKGKPVTKTAFKKLADVHTYGYGKRCFNVAYFRNSKDCMYGFYPQYQGDSQTKTLQYAYENFRAFIDGDSEPFDMKDIQFGNTGIPIGYGDLRVRYTGFDKPFSLD
ncbi:MAG: hypothetical protein V4580_17395 [Bacteroidota bacterium]